MITVVMCAVMTAKGQVFSAKVVQKIKPYDNDSLMLLLERSPIILKSKPLTVNVVHLHTYNYASENQKLPNQYRGLFKVILSGSNGSQASVFIFFSFPSNPYFDSVSWFIGDDHRKFDSYMSHGDLKQEYRQCIIDGISDWVLKLP